MGRILRIPQNKNTSKRSQAFSEGHMADYRLVPYDWTSICNLFRHCINVLSIGKRCYWGGAPSPLSQICLFSAGSAPQQPQAGVTHSCSEGCLFPMLACARLFMKSMLTGATFNNEYARVARLAIATQLQLSCPLHNCFPLSGAEDVMKPDQLPPNHCACTDL